MDQWPRIRRLSDGAIDYDFYRGKARAHRAAAINEVFSSKRLKGLLDPPAFLARLRVVRKG